MALSFVQKEECCGRWFDSLPPVFHCVSQENFELIFVDESEYRDAMLIFAICCKLSPDVRVFTFEIMSNHFHIVAGGDGGIIKVFLESFVEHLRRYFKASGRHVVVEKLHFNIFSVNDLTYFRATIAYCNRNGFVVNENVTPFSYPWGANGSYFNPVARRYYDRCRERITVRLMRDVFHSRLADDAKGLYSVDDCVSPFCFCEIETGENAFRDAKQYFYSVSRNVESYQKVAAIIGESVTFTDEDLYVVSRKISRERYGVDNPFLLSAQAKVEMAQLLHTEYNAGNKQIVRLLKIDKGVVDSMF